jgi:hypothetical protein
VTQNLNENQIEAICSSSQAISKFKKFSGGFWISIDRTLRIHCRGEALGLKFSSGRISFLPTASPLRQVLFSSEIWLLREIGLPSHSLKLRSTGHRMTQFLAS